MKTIQNELGSQVLTDFEEVLSVRGAKVLIHLVYAGKLDGHMNVHNINKRVNI